MKFLKFFENFEIMKFWNIYKILKFLENFEIFLILTLFLYIVWVLLNERVTVISFIDFAWEWKNYVLEIGK
jgi:hypothetical protein